MVTKRWLRSEIEGEYKIQGGREDKGKSKMEEDAVKEVLTVEDDSEDNVEMIDSDSEDRKQKGERTIREGKRGRHTDQEDEQYTEEESHNEEEE